MTTAHSSLLTAEDLQSRFEALIPGTFSGESGLRILRAEPMFARVFMPFDQCYLRPGDTIAGPAMFTLVDCAFYAAVLATIGWKPMAATTNITISFLSKPLPCAMVADCRLLKVGRRLAVGEAHLRSEGSESVVALATGSYAIPSA